MRSRLPQSGRQATLDSASAGRSRAARQPPNDPAISPPRTARTTAAMITLIVTGALRCTATVSAARAALENPPRNGLVPPPPRGNPPAPPVPPPPKNREPPGVADPVDVPSVAVSDPEK